MVLFPTIFCSGCKKEDLTDTTDITQFSWKLKSITIDGDKSTTPKKNYHGEKIVNEDVYTLTFVNDSTFKFNLSINSGEGKYGIPKFGEILIYSFGTTYVCCNSGFEQDFSQIISKITSYQVLSDYLILKGINIEIEFEK